MARAKSSEERARNADWHTTSIPNIQPVMLQRLFQEALRNRTGHDKEQHCITNIALTSQKERLSERSKQASCVAPVLWVEAHVQLRFGDGALTGT